MGVLGTQLRDAEAWCESSRGDDEIDLKLWNIVHVQNNGSKGWGPFSHKKNKSPPVVSLCARCAWT